jgi:hypothetical protein
MWTNRNRGWSVERAREPPPGTGRGTQVRARALLFHAHLGLLFLLLRATARRTSRPRAMLTGDRRNSGREVSGTRDPPAGTGARTERTSNSSSSRARGRGPTAGGGGGGGAPPERPSSRFQHLREPQWQTHRCSGATVGDSPRGPL